MKIFKTKPLIHHFKIQFPIPSSRVQSCLAKVQQLTPQNTEAIFLSLNGFCIEPQIAQTLHNVFQITNEKWKIPVYTFLEENATALSYYASTCGIVSANPYCVIGDIGTAHKTYTNVEKLLKFFNIKLDSISCHNSNLPWNPFKAPTQQQKEISQKWIQAVEQNMLKAISERRRLPLQTLRTLRNKVFTPKEALSNKLIDHVQTVEEFKDTHFPHVRLTEHLFATTSKTPNISGSEIKVLMQVQQVLEMPKVAMLSMEDPLTQCIPQVIELVKARMQSQQKLGQLDLMLGKVFESMQLKMQNDAHFVM